MNRKLYKTYKTFIDYFRYAPNFPNDLDFDQNEYADFLQKCIDDNIDYTIEKYGTEPLKYFGRAEVLID